MAFKIIWESPNSVWVQFSGVVTFVETVAATNAVYADSRSDRIKCALWDFSTIADFRVTEGEVEEMAFTDFAASHYMCPMKAAFIIGDPRLRVLGEQYMEIMLRLGSRWRNQLFGNLNDARKWLAAVC